MPEPIVISYGVSAAAFAVLTSLLAYGAWRNHFRYHRVRPVILALAWLSAWLCAQHVLRVFSAYLRTVGRTAEYLAFLTSPAWLAVNVGVAVGVAVLLYTLVVAYPETRERRTEERG